MNRTIILAVAIVAIVGAGIWYMGAGTDAPPTPAVNDEAAEAIEGEEVFVAYTDSGYDADRVVVSRGTTVTFTNESSGSMWPASGIHPTHLILPEFDPKRPLSPGETYSFTFTREGTWPFHDHIMPAHTGEIVVE